MIINGQKCLVTPVEKTSDEVINEVLEIPRVQPKKRKLGPARVPGLSRCVSSEEYINRLREMEEAKAQKAADIERRKREMEEARAQKAADIERRKEERRVAREQKKLLAEAKALSKKKNGKGKGIGKGKSNDLRRNDEDRQRAEDEENDTVTRPKRRMKKKKFFDEGSDSEDSEEVEYADSSSEEMSEDEEDALYYRCSECGKRFKKEERQKAIGCDSDHCRRWYHPECTDVDVSGKTEAEIQRIEFVCKYC